MACSKVSGLHFWHFWPNSLKRTTPWCWWDWGALIQKMTRPFIEVQALPQHRLYTTTTSTQFSSVQFSSVQPWRRAGTGQGDFNPPPLNISLSENFLLVGKFSFKKYKICGWKCPISESICGKLKFWALISPLWEMCSCLSEKCNFQPPTLWTQDAAVVQEHYSCNTQSNNYCKITAAALVHINCV